MWYKELKEIRLAIGMQAKELAEKVGKSATYISRIESGAILNTSFDIVSSIARVIAEDEKIKSGTVDLSKYNSDFSKLVLSYRYETMKEVYDYVKENKEVEKYSNIIRYLNDGDIDLFETVARYRVAERNFNDAKREFKEAILMDSQKKNINEVVKMCEKEGCSLVLSIKDKISVEDIIKGSYSDFMEVLTNQIIYSTENIRNMGIYEIVEMKEYPSEIETSSGDEEIILEEPLWDRKS